MNWRNSLHLQHVPCFECAETGLSPSHALGNIRLGKHLARGENFGLVATIESVYRRSCVISMLRREEGFETRANWVRQTAKAACRKRDEITQILRLMSGANWKHDSPDAPMQRPLSVRHSGLVTSAIFLDQPGLSCLTKKSCP